MTIILGRAGSDVGAIHVNTMNLSGNELSLSGWLLAESEADLKALRQQVVGLADSPDETVIPIVFAGDESITGFYRVSDLTVPSPNEGTAQMQGAAPWSGTFSRIPGYAWASCDLVGVLAYIENVHDWTDLDGFATVWVPDTAVDVAGTGPTGPMAATSRTRALAPDGLIDMVEYNWSITGPGTIPAACSAGMRLEATGFYTGAVTLRAGSPLRTIVGRQIPAEVFDDGWQITNGIITLTASGDDLIVSTFDEGDNDFVSVTAFTLSRGGVSINGLGSPRILRSTPETVVVRFTAAPGVLGIHTVDIKVDRGRRHVQVKVASTPDSAAWALIPNPTYAATSLLSFDSAEQVGAYRTAAVDGYRTWIATASNPTVDTGTGEVEVPDPMVDGASIVFAIGFDEGAGWSGSNLAEWIGQPALTQYVVSR